MQQHVNNITKKFKELNIDFKEYTRILIEKYKSETDDTIKNKLRHKLFDVQIPWIYYCYKQRNTFYDFDINEEFGYVYERLVKTLDRFDLDYGVPFHIYFERDLRGNFLYRMKCDKKKYQIDADEYLKYRDEIDQDNLEDEEFTF